MDREENRLNSFGDSESLAKDGFFLNDGVIKCFSCGINPEKKEEQQSFHGPRPCKFVLNRHRYVPYKRFTTTGLEDLKFETRRLSTFSIDWPDTGVKPEDLARDGFYYTRTLDRCECIFCGLILGNWKEGMTPRKEHKKYSPRCPLKHSNVPKESSECFKLKINKEINYLKYSQYASASTRRRSFYNWPYLTQRPDALSDAGFFYFGKGDHVMCFHCGNGLRNWLVGENPWIEHARYYPHCQFVRIHKSPNFVGRIERNEEMMD